MNNVLSPAGSFLAVLCSTDNRFSSDCGPGHLIDPGEPNVHQASGGHQVFDHVACPIVCDPRQHLVEDYVMQVVERKRPQQTEILDRSEPNAKK